MIAEAQALNQAVRIWWTDGQGAWVVVWCQELHEENILKIGTCRLILVTESMMHRELRWQCMERERGQTLMSTHICQSTELTMWLTNL